MSKFIEVTFEKTNQKILLNCDSIHYIQTNKDGSTGIFLSNQSPSNTGAINVKESYQDIKKQLAEK